jgi:antitoxin VapB
MPRRRAAAAEKDETQNAPSPGSRRAKVFANGRSQAVRLPKEFRVDADEVLVSREGARLVLEPVTARGWPKGLWRRLDDLAAGLEEEWERPRDRTPLPIRRERDLP